MIVVYNTKQNHYFWILNGLHMCIFCFCFRKNSECFSDPSELRPQWQPKAEVPPSVPKLPIEYIHHHRLMKQAVNCLLDQVTDTASDKNVRYFVSVYLIIF